MVIKKKIVFFIILGIFSRAASVSPSTQTSTNIRPSSNSHQLTAHGKFFIPLKRHTDDSIFNYIYMYKNNYIIETNINFSDDPYNYKYNGKGSWENERQIRGETKIKIGNNLWISEGIALSPYMGLGVKYKSDYSGGSTTTIKHHLYDRHSTYFFVPMGLKTANRLSNGWAMECSGELDIFLGGRHELKFSTLQGTVTIKQKRRYGAKGAIDFTKSLDKNKKISFGPYINYWNIKNSKVSPIRAGMNSRIPHTPSFEVGLGIKYRF